MGNIKEEPMVFVFPKEWGALEVEEMRLKIIRQIDLHHPMKVIFDLRQSIFMDSSGIGFILGRYKQLQEWNGELILYGVSGNVAKVLRLSGIYSLITCLAREDCGDA